MKKNKKNKSIIGISFILFICMISLFFLWKGCGSSDSEAAKVASTANSMHNATKNKLAQTADSISRVRLDSFLVSRNIKNFDVDSFLNYDSYNSVDISKENPAIDWPDSIADFKMTQVMFANEYNDNIMSAIEIAKNPFNWSDLKVEESQSIDKYFDALPLYSDKVNSLLENIKFISGEMPQLRQIADFSSYEFSNLGHCRALDNADDQATRYVDRIDDLDRNLESLIIPVKWYMILDSEDNGIISLENINRQIDTLNSIFKNSRFEFVLHDTMTIKNDQWFTSIGSSLSYNDDVREKTFWMDLKNRQKKKCLNITSALGDSTFLGESSFPWDNGIYSQGVFINYKTIPGVDNSDWPYNKGKTLAHELGHFFGLYHVFHVGGVVSPFINCADVGKYNGCTGDDLCKDTPQAKYCHMFGCGQCDSNDLGCNCNGKTCQSCNEGIDDPVTNIMSYNPDDCMTEFTKDQFNRMTNYLLSHHSDLLSSGAN